MNPENKTNLIKIDSWLDNSKRKTFNTCERKFYYEYIRNLSFKNFSTPLFFGTIIHAILEEYYKLVQERGTFFLEGNHFNEIYERAEVLIEEEKGERIFTPDYRNWDNAKLLFAEYYLNYCALDQEQMEIIATEQSLFMPWKGKKFLGTFGVKNKKLTVNFKDEVNLHVQDKFSLVKNEKHTMFSVEEILKDKTYILSADESVGTEYNKEEWFYIGTFYGGKIDLICSINGMIGCLDHKTTSQSLSMATRNQHWSPQFMGYQELCRYNGYETTETWVNFLAIKSYFSKKTSTWNAATMDFLRTTENYTQGDIDSWRETVDSHYARYVKCVETKTFVKERDNCYNYGRCCSKDVLCSQNKPLGEELLDIDWITNKWEI